MRIFKVAVSGYMAVEIKAKNAAEAEDLAYEDSRLGELASMEIVEVVPAGKAFSMYTDLD